MMYLLTERFPPGGRAAAHRGGPGGGGGQQRRRVAGRQLRVAAPRRRPAHAHALGERGPARAAAAFGYAAASEE